MKLGYLAGLIDGEGCVSVDERGRPTLTVTNTFEPLVTALQAQFGGIIHIRAYKNPARAHKTVYTWRIRGKEAVNIIRKCARHLIIKSEVAFWVLQAAALRAAYKKAKTRAKQQALVQAGNLVLEQIRWVNHRGTDRDAISPVERTLNGSGPSVNHEKAA